MSENWEFLKKMSAVTVVPPKLVFSYENLTFRQILMIFWSYKIFCESSICAPFEDRVLCHKMQLFP